MDLTLNRKLAGKALPEGSHVISAVNEGEEYQLTDLDPALVSRFNIYEFKPTVEEWLNWAAGQKLDERVVNFIQDNPTWLDGDTKEYKGLDKSADRRAWKHVSDILLKVDTIKDIHKRIIAGIVGTVEKYQLHEYAILNEAIFRYLENAKLNEREKKETADSLGKYITFLRSKKKREALANFTNIFEKGTYEKAIAFMVVNASSVYDMLNEVSQRRTPVLCFLHPPGGRKQRDVLPRPCGQGCH